MSKFIVYFKQLIFIEHLFSMFNDCPRFVLTALGSQDDVEQRPKICLRKLLFYEGFL